MLIIVASCLGDPVGPGALVVDAHGASPDTAWLGAPGELLPGNVRLTIRDESGRPIRAAQLVWEVFGKGAQLVSAASETDAAGNATAVWRLGTDAAEAQHLHLVVMTSKHQRDFDVRARAVPYVVHAVRALIDTPAVVRLGDTLAFAVNAIDPYGNEFLAPDVAVTVADTLTARAFGAGVIMGPRRGTTVVRVASRGAETFVPVRVVQYVAAIQPATDVIELSSLGAELPVSYQVRDDRSRVVADTVATLAAVDTAIAHVVDGRVKALATGVTAIRASIGAVESTVAVAVNQRIAVLGFRRDTIRFDALQDTTVVDPLAQDSLGSAIPHPRVELRTTNQNVVEVTGSVLRAVTPGVTQATIVDPVTGVAATIPVIVEQRVASIYLASVSFDALGDAIALTALPRDRLGYDVQDAALIYAVSDPSVAEVNGDRLVSRREGFVTLTAQDPITGTISTANILVAQRVTSLELSTSDASFDALNDTLSVGFTARDRLGAVAAAAAVNYASSDTAVVRVSGRGGQLQALGNGLATVTVSSPDGPSASVQVVVAQRVVGIRLDRDSVVFESLNAVQQVRGIPVDRLGSPVAAAGVVYAVDDPSVVAVDEVGQVRAVANGTAELMIASGVDTARVALRVTQRPVRVVFPSDTIRFTAFGDSASIQATALDSLGSPVSSEISAAFVVDNAIAEFPELPFVRARGNGTTDANVTVEGIAARVAIVVDQVVTTLNASVIFGNQVITLDPGAQLPTTCEALDRNGFAIVRPILITSLRGTVAGTCTDARVERSGYDTLVFAVSGVETRVPVIVSTAPDSVGIIANALPLPTSDRIRFVGEDLNHPSIVALRPLVEEILITYANPPTNLGRARALRDWVARTAVDPDPRFHPGGSTSNRSVLPSGAIWADVNALPFEKTFSDRDYWLAVGFDGYAMLNRVLGTLDVSSGERADDGMMRRVGSGRYQIRDIATYRYVLCTFQDVMLNALWAAAGLHGMVISTIDHDPAAVFIPELGRWIYEDPTFNEEYSLDGNGEPLSPGDLLRISGNGDAGRLESTKFAGPAHDPEPYVSAATYLNTGHPDGMVIMGSNLLNRGVGVEGWHVKLVQIDVPRLQDVPLFNNETTYARVTEQVAFPQLGVVVDQIVTVDSVNVVHLSSTLPAHTRFERRLLGGTWETVTAVDVLPVGSCSVEYRSVDVRGNSSSSAVLSVWAPRSGDFLQSGDPTGPRQTTQLCVS